MGTLVTMGADHAVLRELEQDGPLTHDDLCERVGVEWDELSVSIRRLRNAGSVVLTLDRRYDIADGGGA